MRESGTFSHREPGSACGPRAFMRALWMVFSVLATATVEAAELTAPAPSRDFYFPNTEELAPDEMRVIALGTGTPHIRPVQAATSWLVELGNGDKFLFDVGTGSLRNFAGLQISYNDVYRVFFSHLHVDHVGDFDALWASGWTGGRLRPLQVWGPSGTEPRLGTRHYVETLRDAMYWDYATRSGILPEIGSGIEVHEFDYSQAQVVYEENGVTVRSFPSVHILDGAVSYRLEWKGLSFVFSGDVTPNKWMVEYGKNVDLLVHEVYMTIGQLMEHFGWDRQMAMTVSRRVHTTPAAAGEMFSLLQPRMAVGFHFYNDPDTAPEIEREIRKAYDGPLTLARDLTVFNLRPGSIHVRQAVTPQRTWPMVPDREDFARAKRAQPRKMSDWLRAGQLPIDIYTRPEDSGAGAQ